MTKEGRQAGDIEVTPEMIEAGVGVLVEFERDWTDPKEHVVDIYRAMNLVACRGGGLTSAPSRDEIAKRMLNTPPKLRVKNEPSKKQPAPSK